MDAKKKKLNLFFDAPEIKTMWFDSSKLSLAAESARRRGTKKMCRTAQPTQPTSTYLVTGEE